MNPTAPQKCAGSRMEPAPSVPRCSGPQPAPAQRGGAGRGAARRHAVLPRVVRRPGQRIVADRGPALLGAGGLAEDDAPAARSRATSGASAGAGAGSDRREPRRVGRPATAWMSLMVAGHAVQRAERRRPRMTASSALRARRHRAVCIEHHEGVEPRLPGGDASEHGVASSRPARRGACGPARPARSPSAWRGRRSYPEVPCLHVEEGALVGGALADIGIAVGAQHVDRARRAPRSSGRWPGTSTTPGSTSSLTRSTRPTAPRSLNSRTFGRRRPGRAAAASVRVQDAAGRPLAAAQEVDAGVRRVRLEIAGRGQQAQRPAGGVALLDSGSGCQSGIGAMPWRGQLLRIEFEPARRRAEFLARPASA